MTVTARRNRERERERERERREGGCTYHIEVLMRCLQSHMYLVLDEVGLPRLFENGFDAPFNSVALCLQRMRIFIVHVGEACIA